MHYMNCNNKLKYTQELKICYKALLINPRATHIIPFVAQQGRLCVSLREPTST